MSAVLKKKAVSKPTSRGPVAKCKFSLVYRLPQIRTGASTASVQELFSLYTCNIRVYCEVQLKKQKPSRLHHYTNKNKKQQIEIVKKTHQHLSKSGKSWWNDTSRELLEAGLNVKEMHCLHRDFVGKKSHKDKLVKEKFIEKFSIVT